jgi:hypothetical protein
MITLDGELLSIEFEYCMPRAPHGAKEATILHDLLPEEN